MRSICSTGLLALLTAGVAAGADTPAAAETRASLLKLKVTAEFKAVPLREVLKEFAAQVDMQAERPVMWTYGPDVPAAKPITYTCNEKPLEKVLNDLCRIAGVSYAVISAADDRHDGWVRITAGAAPGSPTTTPGPMTGATDMATEREAAEKLTLARSLVDGGKGPQARAVLQLITRKYPGSKAAAEAKALLEKLDK